MNRILFVFLSVLASLPISVGAECNPPSVVRMVVEDLSPGIPEGHFAALPKTIYRQGTLFARIEEEPDQANNIHGLIVMNNRDSWIVNRSTKTGTHVIDVDETPGVHAPILAGFQAQTNFPSVLTELEFGCEVEFFDVQKSPVTPLSGDTQGRVKQALGSNGWMAVLVRAGGSGAPQNLVLMKGDDVVFAVRYLAYERGVANDGLFLRPAGITYEEAKPK